MIRKLTTFLAALALWAALPAASQAQTHGCACLSNRVGAPIQFKFQEGNLPWDTRTLGPNQVFAFCHAYGSGPKDSPPLKFQFNRAVGGAPAWTTYNIERVRGDTTDCKQVSPIGQYYVSFQANSNNQLVEVRRVQASAAAPPPGPATNTRVQACACLHNQVERWLPFQYAFGAEPLKNAVMAPGHNWGVCESVLSGHPFPPLKVQIDRDASASHALTNYEIKPVVAPNNQCASIPPEGQYNVAFQPGTNKQFLHVAHRGSAAAAPARPAPTPSPTPGTSQATFGCACVNNGVAGRIQFQFRWGNDPFRVLTLDPGKVYAFCWPYGAGPHSSPPLQFMLNRATDGSTMFTNYALNRVQSPTNQCVGVPKPGQYWVRFQPGTNNQFLHVVKQ